MLESVCVRLQSCVYGSAVPYGDRTVVLGQQRTFGRSVCQPFP